MADTIEIIADTPVTSTITVSIQDTPVQTISVTEEIKEISVLTVGVPGPIGPKGDPGDQGIPGPEYGTYNHVQAIASTVWNITHNLNKYPKVVIVDSSMSMEEVFGDVRYVDLNRLEVTFGSPFTGEAYLS